MKFECEMETSEYCKELEKETSDIYNCEMCEDRECFDCSKSLAQDIAFYTQ